MAALVKISRQCSQLSCCVCPRVTQYTTQRYNSNHLGITKTRRFHYERTYPVMLVNPDGSTTLIRCDQPRKIIKLPVDTANLTHEETMIRLARVTEVKKVKVKEEIETSFDSSQYANMV